jgi:hypothetical protein
VTDFQLSGQSRVFLTDGRARPSLGPTYEGLMRAGALSWAQGDVTLIRRPDPDRYGKFLVVGKLSGEEGNPEMTLTARYTKDLSKLFKLARKRCDFDLQIHMGECQDPRDFNRGWDKIMLLDAARITTYGTTDLGALEASENAVVNEEVPVAAEDVVEIVPLGFGTKAATNIVREVIDVEICDTEACGDCGRTSDGCQRVFAVVNGSEASPGIPPMVVYSEDAGNTWRNSNITSLTGTESPTDADCVGGNLVVASQEAGSLHVVDIEDLLDGIGVWSEVSTGFVVPAGSPRKMHSVSSVHTWIVGAGGYIYLSADPTSSVTIQDAGNATIQQLNDIHAMDEMRAVAVGNSNAVVYTLDGTTWISVLGPAPGVSLNAVWMKDRGIWMVGGANGRLYFTENFGLTWFEKVFPGAGVGQVRDIAFFNNAVGYLAHSTAAPAGRILRTLDGGYSWYVLPERAGVTVPANDYISSIAVCSDVNTVYLGGLDDNALDGILIKGTGG